LISLERACSLTPVYFHDQTLKEEYGVDTEVCPCCPAACSVLCCVQYACGVWLCLCLCLLTVPVLCVAGQAVLSSGPRHQGDHGSVPGEAACLPHSLVMIRSSDDGGLYQELLGLVFTEIPKGAFQVKHIHGFLL